MKRTYTRRTSTSAAGSRKPTFKDYGVEAFCAGCGRKLVASKEPAMWFTGIPARSVFGYCCWQKACDAS